MEDFYEGRYLCYGDRIVFEITDLEGCESGGIFGVQELKYSNQFLTLESELKKIHTKNASAANKVTLAQKFSELSNDVTRKRYFGFSALTEQQSGLQPPNDFFLNNIFTIVAGVGFEAVGEPVYYGSQIKLMLVSTQEYLFAAGDQLELLRKADFEKYHLKECNFKIKPCHGVRLDGDRVFYNDLIVLVDNKGRDLVPMSKNEVIFRQTVSVNRGLRIGIYLSTTNLEEGAIYGGEVIQLFHKTETSFLIAIPEHGNFRKIKISAQIESLTFLQNSVSLWQVETLPSGDRRLKADGSIFQCTPIRLRHIMTSKLLKYDENVGFSLIDVPEDGTEDPTVYEFRVNLDALHEDDTVGVSGLRIKYDSMVRLFHVASQSYIILRKDAKSLSNVFQTTMNNFDKDVFQIFPISPGLLETVLAAKRLRLGMGLVLDKLNVPNIPKFERNALIQTAAKFLSLCVGEGSFLSKSEKEQSSVTHLIANEFGFVDVLLQIAQNAFQHSKGQLNLTKDEELLAKSAYSGIASLLKMDCSSCRPVIKCEGVSQMVKHFTLIHPKLNWNPPLIELADAINLESSKPGAMPILAFTDEEIRDLLDKVHIQILDGQVPKSYAYELLAKACCGRCDLITNQLNGAHINKTMQMMIVEQLLGSPHDISLASPSYSVLVYKPLIEEDVSLLKEQTVEFSKRFKFLISTSPIGQLRPFKSESLPLASALRPGGLTVELCSDEEYLEIISFRNKNFSPYYHWKDSFELKKRLSLLNVPENSKMSTVISDVFQSIEWKSIYDFKDEELDFFAATLKLLSALCVGRNVWCQRIVRKLFPVDYILVFVDSLKEHSSLTNPKLSPTTAHLFTSVKTMMISLLHTCYVDSAYIPPLWHSIRESVLTNRNILGKSHKYWEDVLYEECTFKVFSLFSQVDSDLFEVSTDMSNDDISLLIENLPMENLQGLLKTAGFACANLENFAKNSFKEEIIAMKEDPDQIPNLRSMLQSLKISLKQFYAARSVHCFEQRALLMKIVLDFMNDEAFIVWSELVQKPLVEITAVPDHIAFDKALELGSNSEFQEVEEEIAEMRRNIHLLKAFFALIQSLLIRGFFSHEYNALPVYLERDGEEKSFYEGYDTLSFGLQHYLTYDERTIHVVYCVERLQSKPTSLETGGDLLILRVMINCIMRMLSVRPGRRLHQSLCNMNEDEKNIEEYFNRQYGHSLDRYNLIAGVMEVKLTCCRALSVIVDVVQVSTEKELEKLFNLLFESLLNSRTPVKHGNQAEDGAKSIIQKFTFSVHQQHLLDNLTFEEVQHFRKKLQLQFTTNLSRNADLIWNIPELFHEKSFHIFLHQVLDNNKDLRAELFHLIFRLNARRSELNDMLLKEIKLTREIYSPTNLYLIRQRNKLQDVLCRFNQCFDLTVQRDSENFLPMRIPLVLNKIGVFTIILKNLLLNDDELGGDLGLINYCYYENIESLDGALVGSHPVEEFKSDHENYSPNGQSPKEDKKKLGIVAFLTSKNREHGHNEEKESHDRSASKSPLHPPNNPIINVNSNIADILCLPINEIHLRQMIPFQLHTVIIDFIISNLGSFNAESELYKSYSSFHLQDATIEMTEHFFPALGVMRYLLLFIRSFVNNSLKTLRNVLSKRFMSALFDMRYCVPEAIDFIIEILERHPNQGIVDYIEDRHFHSILEDVKIIIQNPEKFTGKTRNMFGACKVERISRLFQLLLVSDNTQVGKFMVFFLSMLNETIRYQHAEDNLPTKQLAFQRILSIGLDIESEANQSVSFQNAVQFTKLDIKMTCHRYQKETGRVTFSRMPKDILADPYLDETIYVKLKRAFEVWKLLPANSVFQLHLDLVELISNCAQNSTSVQDLYRAAFTNNLPFIFSILFMDKYEIKYSYLQFFNGVWFSRRVDDRINVPHDLMDLPKIQIYMKALLKSFVQDLKLFLLFLKDPELNYNEALRVSSGASFNLSSTLSVGQKSYRLPKSLSGNTLRHFLLHEKYIKNALIPFVIHFFRSDMYQRLSGLEEHDFDVDEDQNIETNAVISAPPSRSNNDTMANLVHSILDLMSELVLIVSGSFLASCDIKGLINMLKSLKDNAHTEQRGLLYTAKSIRFLENRDKHVKIMGNRPVNPRNHEEENILKLKKKCLLEFIPEVDRLANMYGYSALDHLLKTPHSRSFFLLDREFEHKSSTQAFPHLSKAYQDEMEYDASAAVIDPRFHLVTNPLNCETFHFTVIEVSKLLVAYCKYRYPDRFAFIMKLINRIPNNQETEFQRFWNPYLEELENYSVEKLLLRNRSSRSSSWTTFKKGETTQIDDSEIEKFSEFQLLRWTKYGGRIISLLFEHLQNTLQSYQSQSRASSYSLDELTKCNSYWIHTLTKGLLKSKIGFLFEKYAEQTEIQLMQLEVEGNKLAVMQDILCDLGAANLIIRHLSMPHDVLSKAIHTRSIETVYSMVVEFGSALCENGNPVAQKLFIDAIEVELKLSHAAGYNFSFVQVVRGLLRHYSVVFQSREITHDSVSKAVNLLRLLQLFCERHNEKAQLYLGENKIVTEVATFVNDISLLLARELSDAFVSEEELMLRDQPTILGFHRSIIRWISPLPESFKMQTNTAARAKSVRKLPTNTGSRIYPLNASPSKFSSSAPLNNQASEYDIASDDGAENHKFTQNQKPKLLDIERIKLLAELVTAGLEALTEFSQGPRPNIQLMIARSGVTSEFDTFFKFFGALHLLSKVDFDTKTMHQLHQFRNLFESNVKYRVTSDAILELNNSNDSPTDTFWIGNDPLAILLVLSAINDDGSHTIQDLESKNTKSSMCKECLENIQDGIQDSCGSFSNVCYQFLSCEHNYFEEDILDLEREFQRANLQRSLHEMDLDNLHQWSKEKHLYIEYRKRKDKMTQTLTDNYYEMLSEFEEAMVDMEKSCIKFLSSLIEAFSNVEKEKLEIPTIIFQDIRKESLVCNMANYWNRYLNYYQPVRDGDAKESYDRALAYQYYTLLNQFLDLNAKDVTTDLDELMQRWLEETEIPVSEHIARIEVRSPADSKSLVVTYFPVPELVKTYWYRTEIEEFRDYILFPTTKGTRDSIDEKVKNFLKDGQRLIMTLRHLESLDEIIAPQSIFLRIVVDLAHGYKRWNFGTFVLTIALNILLLLSVRLNDDESSYYIAGFDKELIYILGLAHFGCTGLTFLSFMIMFGWLYIKMGIKANEKNEFEVHGYFVARSLYYLNKVGLVGQWGSAELIENIASVRLWTVTAATIHLLSNYDVLYFTTLMLFSGLGNFQNPLFFALCLMEVLRLSKLMLYVTRAFTVNIGQVIATIALAAILFYLFATYSFSSDVIRNKYYFNGFGNGGCTSLQVCLRLHLDYGLLQSVFWDYPNEIETYEGEIFNFVFTFIMQIVIPGLISGIIIDTFSSMRQEKEDLEEDVYNTCFICNIDREDFESMNISFDTHIRNDHNLWKYLWFIIYLFEKDFTEFDGVESACHAIIEPGDFSTRWLPVKMARALSTIRDKYDLFTIYNKITALQNMIDRFTGNMKNDMSKTEKHLKEAFKEELAIIETHTREIVQKLDKKKGDHHTTINVRAGAHHKK